MAPPVTGSRYSSPEQGRHALDRLSLSPPSQRRAIDAQMAGGWAPPQIPHKNSLRGTTSRAPDRPSPLNVAGPSYESMASLATPARTNTKSEPSRANGTDYYTTESMHGVISRGPETPERYVLPSEGQSSMWTCITDLTSANPVGSPRGDTFTSVHIPPNPQPLAKSDMYSASPPRARNPIYPALASPPREYPAASSSSSPSYRTPTKLDRPAVLKVDTTSPGLNPRTNTSTRTITGSSPGMYS
jgi:hypothetical protein